MAFLQGERDAKPVAPKPKTKGRVIVVGAGPAGLAAALHLKVGNYHPICLTEILKAQTYLPCSQHSLNHAEKQGNATACKTQYAASKMRIYLRTDLYPLVHAGAEMWG